MCPLCIAYTLQKQPDGTYICYKCRGVIEYETEGDANEKEKGIIRQYSC